MDLHTFRQIVDNTESGIADCEGDLRRLYDYVELDHGPAYTHRAISEALYARIRDCFISGRAAVWRTCGSLQTDLIREHVLSGAQLEPYCEVLHRLKDAIQIGGDPQTPIEGDWRRAIRTTLDHIQIDSLSAQNLEKTHSRNFIVANEARALREEGFAIQLEPGKLRLEQSSEIALINCIEDLVSMIGGINVARRIFEAITPQYDAELQRYHMVRDASLTGVGRPETPWGYLLQLAAKHARSHKRNGNTDAQWQKLCRLTTAFAAVIDVQSYAPIFFGGMVPHTIARHLQEMAVYDTLFQIPQLRPKDVIKIARGMFSWLDTNALTKAGWSVDQVLEIIGYLLDPIRDVRGPVSINAVDICHALPHIPRSMVIQILDGVLSHPPTGANRNFSRPTDAPIADNPDLKDAGHDFFLRPLLHQSGRRFWLLDRSVCAPACLEALLTSLREERKDVDDNVGISVERFLEAEFTLHGIPVCAGNYVVEHQHGECDLVIETPETVIFAELKKKTLTRRARAGSDAHLLLDFSGSLLAAQVQAGWHEVRLRRHNNLCLERNGGTACVNLNGRGIERIAVSLFDFGSFQDRILTKQFLESTMKMEFKPLDQTLERKFCELNKSLAVIRDQIMALYPDQKEINQPFFNCWFLSVPQMLALLDGVTNGSEFRAALWNCRHIATGRSDFYYDLSYMRRCKKAAAMET